MWVKLLISSSSPSGEFRATRPASLVHLLEGGKDANHGRPDRDQKERGKEAECQRKYHLGADLGGHFLGSLHALVTKLFRIHPQGVRNAGAESHGLHQQRDQAAYVVQAAPIG